MRLALLFVLVSAGWIDRDLAEERHFQATSHSIVSSTFGTLTLDLGFEAEETHNVWRPLPEPIELALALPYAVCPWRPP